MKKVEFGTLNVGDIFFIGWEEDIIIKCMKCGYYDELLTDKDDCDNAVWLSYKAGVLDYCPDNIWVYVLED